MILQNEYLSDEELEQLMQEAEADLVPAPPELEERVWKLINTQNVKNKNKEFAAYCFRVGIAAAAAIAFVFMLPYLPENHISPENMREEMLTEQQEWEDAKVQDYPTKEEVLNDAGLLQKVFGAKDIFTESQETDYLRENGGL